MDFLDSLDLETTYKKSNRVRSWYLYEQYKSLERHQLDAAQKLRDRSYQDRILHQELSERRARRKLYDEFGLSQTESALNVDGDETKTPNSVSTGDFFETYCELQEDVVVEAASNDFGIKHLTDQDHPSNSYLDDFKSFEDDNSNAESVNSVVEKDRSNYILVDDVNYELETVKRDIEENITKQMETVKQNMICLEKYGKMCEDDLSKSSTNEQDAVGKITRNELTECDNSVYIVWSKLVSFAYQIIKLNHGNCYYDYSSQLLTAVLACDIIRRGVNRMCISLQPYVSPIKYAEYNNVSNETYKNMTENNSVLSKKTKKIVDYKLPPKHYNTKFLSKKQKFGRPHHSESQWPHCSKFSSENLLEKKCRRASEPWRSLANISNSKKNTDNSSSNNSIWPDEFSKTNESHDEICKCGCQNQNVVVNPMLKISRYIDSMLKDIDECKRI